MTSKYEFAKKKLIDLDIKNCEDYFRKNKYYLELGYCELIKGNLENAKRIFANISNYNPRAHWALRLIQFIEGYITFLPTYFEVRNFLEVDLDLLINANKHEWVENIINGYELFYSVNSESYKFIGRVLINNDYPDIAKIFLDKGMDKTPFDPELHIILAEYYITQNEKSEAIKILEKCLKFLPNYYPANKKLAELKELSI